MARRRTGFPGLDPRATNELIGVQDDIHAEQDRLRADAIGTTTENKTSGTYAAKYNERVRCFAVAAGVDIVFPASNPTTQNKWIIILKLGGGDVRIKAVSGQVQGVATVTTLTSNGYYYFESDGITGWWIQPAPAGGIAGVLLTENAGASLGSMTTLDVDDSAEIGVTATFLAGVGKLVWAVVAASLALTKLATQAANTIVANATAGAASPTAVAVGTNTVVGRVAGNIVAAGLVNAQVDAAAGINYSKLETVAANTLTGNPTASVTTTTQIALAVQSSVIRAAANTINATAAADTCLQRLGSADLGYSNTPRLMRAPQIITASNAAFAHPTGTRFLVVEGCGGGGGGAGTAAAAGACGSGGNAGNWGTHTFPAPVSATSAVTIGAAGTTGSAAAGGNGGNSTFTNNAITLTLPGGIGGTLLAGLATVAAAVANAGNAASTNADVGTVGQIGQQAYRNAAATTAAIAGNGGSNPLGSGGLGFGGVTAVGKPATGFGGGGSGACGQTALAQAGGAATAGVFIVWEFG